MPKQMDPSSFLCVCGYSCDFCINTIFEMKELSQRRKKEQCLVADDNEHEVVFHKGKWVALVCPKRGRQPRGQAGGEDGAMGE